MNFPLPASRVLIGPALIMGFSSAACGSKASKAPNSVPQNQQESASLENSGSGYSGFQFVLADSNTPETNPEQIVSFGLSMDPHPELREKLRVSIALNPAIVADTLEPFWNADTQEGLLRLSFSSREAYGIVPYVTRSTYYLSNQNYLFTDFSQQNLSFPYDTQQGLIRLKLGSENLPVGHYRLPVVGHEYQTWTHPELCEGTYSATCSMSVELSFNADKKYTTFPYRGTFYITLKAGVLTDEPVKLPLAIIPELDVVKSGDPFAVAQPKRSP